MRSGHFAKEKVFLAETFGKLLTKRLQNLCRGTQDVILFIDAGTTLLPFFKILDEFARTAKNCNKHFVVVTNNLAGANWLSEFGSFDENDELYLKCVLLPGELLPKYSAITGFEESIGTRFSKTLAQLDTNKSIEIIKNLRDSENGKLKLLALVTGNWVRIRNEKPKLPVPLARGRGHLHVKESMIKNADEVYVISPLGKIFSNQRKTKVLGLLEDYSDAYEELNTEKTNLQIISKNRTKIKLVTTYRTDSRFLLSPSSDMIYNSLLGEESEGDASAEPYISKVEQGNLYDCAENFSTCETAEIPHFMFEFKDVSSDETIQLNEEFPHSYCHSEEFLEHFHILKDDTKKWLKRAL
jgi:hypothetical protein